MKIKIGNRKPLPIILREFRRVLGLPKTLQVVKNTGEVIIETASNSLTDFLGACTLNSTFSVKIYDPILGEWINLEEA